MVPMKVQMIKVPLNQFFPHDFVPHILKTYFASIPFKPICPILLFFGSTTSCRSRNPAFLVIHVHYSHHCHGCQYAFISQWYTKRIADFFVSYPGSKLYLNSADENDNPKTTYEQYHYYLPGPAPDPRIIGRLTRRE